MYAPDKKIIESNPYLQGLTDEDATIWAHLTLNQQYIDDRCAALYVVHVDRRLGAFAKNGNPVTTNSAQQDTYDAMLAMLSPADKVRHLEADVAGRQVHWDRSGTGQDWVLADTRSMPASARAEIAAEIRKSNINDCSDYLASNGQYYRWR